MAGLLAAVERHRDRLDQLRPRVLVGEFAGAAGTLASIERGAMETQEGLMAELGLGQPVIAWRPRQHRRRSAASWVWSAARWASCRWTSS